MATAKMFELGIAEIKNISVGLRCPCAGERTNIDSLFSWAFVQCVSQVRLEMADRTSVSLAFADDLRDTSFLGTDSSAVDIIMRFEQG